MASYSLSFKPSVEKDLSFLSKNLLARILARIEQLKTNPFPPQSIKLQGAERLHRTRVGDYRIVYEVNQEIWQITIHYVRHRRDVYRRLR